MNCEPYQPVDPCDEPCKLESMPRDVGISEKAIQIYNSNIEKLNCILCPDVVPPTATPENETTAFNTPITLDVVADDLPGDFPICLLYTSPSPRDQRGSRMPSSA